VNRACLLLLACLLLSPIAGSVDSGQRFEDPAEQARYERLIRDLRCLVCRSESIADSNALLARDLRREVETLMRAGKSDAEIHAFMTERYGDFVLLRPPVAPRTWLLWAAPALFLAGGLAAVIVIIRRRARIARTEPGALDEEPGNS
jgi:cytochrome c-type biogenesis protein CcmH